MVKKVAIIGFGEAAQAFVGGWSTRPAVLRAYDRKTDIAETQAAKWADYASVGVTGVATACEALNGADCILSLVTADQALAAAELARSFLERGAFFFDMNSVAPDTKRAAALAVTAAGARYVDAAVLAPALPARAAVPLLLSGDAAVEGAHMLRAVGFSRVNVLPGAVGRSSAVKMIRSVVIKGIEALTAECVLAADAAGVLEEVLMSLDASQSPATWAARADYNLDRMLQHGVRRAAEMEEVAKTLASLGVAADMTRGTIARQRSAGTLGINPPAGLAAKLAVLGRGNVKRAA